MQSGQRNFWVFKQGVLNCDGCRYFLMYRRGTGAPCKFYYDMLVDKNGCIYRDTEERNGKKSARN